MITSVRAQSAGNLPQHGLARQSTARTAGLLGGREVTMTTDSDRKRIYEKVVATVHHQTSPKQAPGCTTGQLWTHLVDHANHDHDKVETAIRAAVEHGDLVEWTDAEGRTRLTPADEPNKCQRAVEWLVDSVDHVTDAQRSDIGALQAAKMEAESDD